MLKRQNTYASSPDVAPRTREILQEDRSYGNGPPQWTEGKAKRPAQAAEEAFESRLKLIKRFQKHHQTFSLAEALLACLERCDEGERCHSAACPECARAYNRWFVSSASTFLARTNNDISVLSLVHDTLKVAIGELTPDHIAKATGMIGGFLIAK